MIKFRYGLIMIMINVLAVTVEIVNAIEGNILGAVWAVLNVPCLIFFVVVVDLYVSSLIKESR